MNKVKLLYLTNGVGNFLSHRLGLATEAVSLGYEVHVVLPPVDLATKNYLISLGINPHFLHFKRSSLNPFLALKVIFSLIKLFRSIRPDLVHLVALKAILYGNIAAKFSSVKATTNAFTGMGHLFISEKYTLRVIRKIILYFFRITIRTSRNSLTILQNDDDAALLIHRKVISASTSRIVRGSGVDLKSFEWLPEPESDFTVVFPARLLKEKGICEFVEAARELKNTYPSWHFALVGSIDLENPASITQTQLDEWLLEGFIEYWGWQEDMKAVFSRCHLVCLPSYREGLPKALLEAAASGRVIVTTNVPGCKDVVQNKKTGLLVPVKSSKALVSAIQTLAASKERRINMGRLARQYVEDRFALKKVISETVSIYDELLR